MKQEMLNNLMIHKEHTDGLDLKQVANDFVSIKQWSTQMRIFGSSFTCHKMGGCGWVGVALALPL